MFRIYVGNLGSETNDESLSGLFSEHGSVNSATVITDRITGRSRGFGFVEMNDAGEAKAAMDALDGKDVHGRSLKVGEARERTDRSAPR